jgi:hypothetical protein
MRNLRKLVLLAMVAIAALAFSASAASAQSVELLNEETGQHCSSFTMSGHDPVGATCTVHATSVGTANLYIHNGTSEVPFSACNNEFEAAFNETGQGYIYNQVLTPEGATCGREPCDEAAPSHENLAWPATLSEVPGGLRLHVVFCLYAHNPDPVSEGSAGTNCEVTLNVTTSADHGFAVSSPAGNPATGDGGAPCTGLPIELQGSWVVADTDNHNDGIEVIH